MTMASAMVAAAPTPKTAAISAAQSAKKGSGTIWMSMSSALRIHRSLVKKISWKRMNTAVKSCIARKTTAAVAATSVPAPARYPMPLARTPPGFFFPRKQPTTQSAAPATKAATMTVRARITRLRTSTMWAFSRSEKTSRISPPISACMSSVSRLPQR